MKKLFTLALLIVAMSVTAQRATYSVVSTQFTVTEDWEDAFTEKMENTMLVIFDFE